jgi:hypothetical protein
MLKSQDLPRQRNPCFKFGPNFWDRARVTACIANNLSVMANPTGILFHHNNIIISFLLFESAVESDLESEGDLESALKLGSIVLHNGGFLFTN